jgi:hypothetical protein
MNAAHPHTPQNLFDFFDFAVKFPALTYRQPPRTNAVRSHTPPRPCFPRFPWLSVKAGGRPDFADQIPPPSLREHTLPHSPAPQNFFGLAVKILTAYTDGRGD